MTVFFSCYNSHWRGIKNLIRTKYVCVNTLFRKGVIRHFSHEAGGSNTKNEKFVPFMKFLENRKAEAKRTILVQVQSAQSFKELHSYCNSIGTVKNMLHYSTGVDPMHFIIVEFEKESDVSNISLSSSHIMDGNAVPTDSQFMWFRASNRKSGKLKQSKVARLLSENGTKMTNEEDLRQNLRSSCETISQQILSVHDLSKLNDTGVRLRFLTARQIEAMLTGLFPHAAVFPFGSSVNGFGRMGCDLDLVLRLTSLRENPDGRLVFHCKASSGSERSASQRHMETVGDLINLFVPGCTQVRRILQARIPIIKFHQQFTDLECDLSMTNMSGVYMSDFLYLMGEIDPRVRPIIFTVRKWAREVGLTNSSPGRWISNFSLTLLVLAFLQKPLLSPPVLPTLNTLTKLAGPNDEYITEDGINCTFLRNIDKLRFESTNVETLESLLREFFEYYAQFDFANKAVCLNEAVTLTKPEHNAMYIVNPLERGLNVSKNVSLDEVERFKVEVRDAAWILESQEHHVGNWGLLSIFERKKTNRGVNFAFSSSQPRLMDVKRLFQEEKEEEVVTYVNEQTQNEVKNIKKDTQRKIKEFKQNHQR